MQGRSWRPLLEGKRRRLAQGVLLLLLLRERLSHPHGDRRAHRDGQADQVPRPRRLDRALRPAPPTPTRRGTCSPTPTMPRSAARSRPSTSGRRTAIDFRIPDFADDPKKDEPKPPLNAWVLDYRFDQRRRGQGRRRLGARQPRHGPTAPRSRGAGRGTRPAGSTARATSRCPKSESLDPAVGAGPSRRRQGGAGPGVILACGGQSPRLRAAPRRGPARVHGRGARAGRRGSPAGDRSWATGSG